MAYDHQLKVIISGGGTGGHIYPAIAIANALRQRCPNASILFVGAEGRMEMEKVPAAGYAITGLPVAGLQRIRWWKNFSLPFKLWKSLRKAKQIICDFQPDVVVGVGGYASAPVLWAAQRKKIPTLLQEQNSYAGMANKLFAKRAFAICVAYDGMERFFPKEKIRLTGNPVRQSAVAVGSRQSAVNSQQPAVAVGSRQSAVNSRQLTADCDCQLPTATAGCDCQLPTVLVVGGSLGARTLNRAMLQALPALCNTGIHVIWQTGKMYFEQAKAALAALHYPHAIQAVDFISQMNEAFAAADVVVSRAGAGTISELCVAAKACIFVPSPNVAEDHQTKNAQALVEKNAALMVRDDEAMDKLWPTVLELLHDKARIKELEKNISLLAKPDAAEDVVNTMMKYLINT